MLFSICQFKLYSFTSFDISYTVTNEALLAEIVLLAILFIMNVYFLLKNIFIFIFRRQ